MTPKPPKPRRSIALLPARRLAEAVLAPVERFLKIEAASGFILLITALVALLWANSPWASSYERLWQVPISVGVGRWVLNESLHFWINDFLMAIFFLVVGLEIKRELADGALSDVRRAALPVAAAAGGMVVPAMIYLALNVGEPGSSGWGVPMATDIAFAVGVLSLLGRRVPVALRVLLLALAIIDDIGAILVIAVFYSGNINWTGAWYVVGGVAAMVALYRGGVRPGYAFVAPGLVVWGGMLQFGIHPAIAGVLVGLMTPAKPLFSRERFLKVAHQAVDEFDKRSDQGVLGHDLLEPLYKLAQARREAVSPALRLQGAMHPWVAFAIMPLFALANAGVNLDGIGFEGDGSFAVFAGIVAGLAIGKPVGIVAVSWLAVRLGLCVLPAGVNWRGILTMGMVAGIGFTMAIFIVELAFQDPSSALGGIAKLGVLVGTAIAAVAGLILGRAVLQGDERLELSDLTEADVEASTDYWTTGH